MKKLSCLLAALAFAACDNRPPVVEEASPSPTPVTTTTPAPMSDAPVAGPTPGMPVPMSPSPAPGAEEDRAPAATNSPAAAPAATP